MEQIIFTIFPSSNYFSQSFVRRKPLSADVPKQLKTFYFCSNPFQRREFVPKRQCSRTYNVRSCTINAAIQNDTIDEPPLNKRSIIEGLHKYGDIVDGKYRITGLLGQGGASITYEAEVGDGDKVALKAMSLRNMRGWKDLDLFERECRVLQSLKHPSIPQYIDYFEPENIIWDTKAKIASLVDFGAVQDAVSMTMIGSTVVGTKRLKVDFRGFVTMSSHLADIVERLLEPAPEDRFQSAEEVIKTLRLEDGSSYDVFKNDHRRLSSNIKKRQPAGTKVELSRTPFNLKISIPPGGLTAEIAGTGTFAVAWNAFIAFWTGSAIRMGAPVFFTLFSLPFWFVGIGLARRAFSGLVISVDLNFGVKEFFITWKLSNLWSYKVDGQTKDILSVGVIIEAEQNGQPITTCCIKEGIKSHTFGAGLETIEKEWLVQEINDFLGLELPQQDHFLIR